MVGSPVREVCRFAGKKGPEAASRSISSFNSHQNRCGSLDHNRTQKPPCDFPAAVRHSWSMPPNHRSGWRNSAQKAVSSQVKSSRSGDQSPLLWDCSRRVAQRVRQCASALASSTHRRTKSLPSADKARWAQPRTAGAWQNGQCFGDIIILGRPTRAAIVNAAATKRQHYVSAFAPPATRV